MNKFIFIFIFILTNLILINSSPLLQSKSFNESFINLGSYPLKKAFDQSNYLLSANAADWERAKKDCEDWGASLVSIETQEEWTGLKKLLRANGLAVKFWTSGLYDCQDKVWYWDGSNVDFGSWVPWGEGQPHTNFITIQRVIINFIDSWGTESESMLERYICEVSSIPIPGKSFNQSNTTQIN